MIERRQVVQILGVFVLASLLGFVTGQRFAKQQGQGQRNESQFRTRSQVGSWQATFKAPAIVAMPDKDSIFKLEFGRTRGRFFPTISTTFTNLTDRSYFVSILLYAYDSSGRRIGDGGEEFWIGKREVVVSGIGAHRYDIVARTPMSSFVVALNVEE